MPLNETQRHNLAKKIQQDNTAWIVALNAHNFDAHQDPWTAVTASFRAKLSVLSEDELTIQGMLNHWRLIYEAHPGAYIEVVDRYTTVDRSGESAEAYETVKLVDAPLGVVKQGVGVTEWRLVRGEWRAVSHKAIEGMNAAGVV